MGGARAPCVPRSRSNDLAQLPHVRGGHGQKSGGHGHFVYERFERAPSARPARDAFLEERIFGPLGMRDTAYFVPTEKADRVATVHRPDGKGKLAESPNPLEVRSGVSGDGGLHSTEN